MIKHSAQFHVSWKTDIAGVAGTSSESSRNSIKWQKQKFKTTIASLYHKNTIYKILLQSEERCRSSCGNKIRRTDGKMDGRTHERGSFLSSPPPTSNDRKNMQNVNLETTTTTTKQSSTMDVLVTESFFPDARSISLRHFTNKASDVTLLRQ